MPWVVTLHITACSGGANLASAAINDGFQLFYTDANGQFIAIVDDAYTGYIVQISKSGYVARNFALSNTQNGTTQNVCLNTAPPPPPGGGGGISCFIVSAATGSAQSDEVNVLRALRDRVVERSLIARTLIDAVYGEYWQFSPALAERIDADRLTRQGALWVAVKPLIAWYEFAGQLAFEPGDEAAVARGAKALAGACPRWLLPASICAHIGRLRRGEPLPDRAPAPLLELAPRLRQAAALPYIDWAMLLPLERCWALAAEGGDARAEIARWLGDAPVDRLPPPASELLLSQVGALLGLLDFDAAARRRLGERLCAAWPQAAAAVGATSAAPVTVPVDGLPSATAPAPGGRGCSC